MAEIRVSDMDTFVQRIDAVPLTVHDFYSCNYEPFMDGHQAVVKADAEMCSRCLKAGQCKMHSIAKFDDGHELFYRHANDGPPRACLSQESDGVMAMSNCPYLTEHFILRK